MSDILSVVMLLTHLSCSAPGDVVAENKCVNGSDLIFQKIEFLSAPCAIHDFTKKTDAEIISCIKSGSIIRFTKNGKVVFEIPATNLNDAALVELWRIAIDALGTPIPTDR